MEEQKVKCPKCGSYDLHSGKKGYSVKKGALGWILTGGVGLIGGLIGANKIEITCLNCGHKFKPGEKVYYHPESQGTGACQLDEITRMSEDYLLKKKINTPKVNQKSKCANCGTLNDLGVFFCRSCGAKIDYSKLEVVKDGQMYNYMVCIDCDNNTPCKSRKNKYCVHCGKEL